MSAKPIFSRDPLTVTIDIGVHTDCKNLHQSSHSALSGKALLKAPVCRCINCIWSELQAPLMKKYLLFCILPLTFLFSLITYTGVKVLNNINYNCLSDSTH